MERPRMFLGTEETSSTDYVDVVSAAISADAEGISYLVLSIDPDPNADYHVIIAKIMDKVDLEITAIWTLELPHLTSGVYRGFKAGDHIIVRHRTIDPAITIKTGASLAFNEVVPH